MKIRVDMFHIFHFLRTHTKFGIKIFETSFVDHCVIYVVYVILRSCLFIAALWSPACKGLTPWLLFVMSNCDFVTFPCGILCQVCYLIVLTRDFCSLSYFVI